MWNAVIDRLRTKERRIRRSPLGKLGGWWSSLLRWGTKEEEEQALYVCTHAVSTSVLGVYNKVPVGHSRGAAQRAGGYVHLELEINI